MKTTIIFLFSFALSGQISMAQNANNECGADAMHNQLIQTDPVYKKEFMEQELAIKAIIQNQANNKMQTSVYTIPVVVHVKHLGEPIGTGTNVSDAKILTSILNLNNLFRNVTGGSVDCEINFCLAVRDPYGNPTSGIERSTSDMGTWPTSSYFNIFSLPTTMPTGGGFRIWIPYGSIGGPGGLLQHEAGHAFSLNHCYYDYQSLETSCIDQGDGVCDTPPDPGHDGSGSSCTNPGNYMCSGSGNKFRQGQKLRMRAAILNRGILSSLGCVPVTATDAAIEEFVYPIKSTYQCTSPSITPKVKLKNFGANMLTSVIIKYKLDNGTLNSFSWNGSLPQNSATNVTLPLIPITQGAHTILAYSTNPNGTPDQYVYNDSANIINFSFNTIPPPFSLSANVANAPCTGNNSSATVMPVPVSNAVEISEGFEAATDWIAVNGPAINKWYVGMATANGGNKSIYISNNSNANAYTKNSTAIVHFYKDFNFPEGATNIIIKFDWKGVGETSQDYLKVYMVPTSVIPNAGFSLTTGQIGSTYNLKDYFSTETITALDANAGTTKRLVFTWRNNANNLGTQPPAAIDNIIVSYNLPQATPYNYSWNTLPIQATATATNLPAGTYNLTVTVTDANACIKTATVAITQPSPISITTSQTNVSCTGGNNGSAIAAATGGTGTLHYSWNTAPLQTTANAVNLSAATYAVKVTDANSCTKTASVTITQPTTPSSVSITAVYGDTRAFNSETLNQRAVILLCNGSLSGQISLKTYLSANNVLDASDILADQQTIHALNPSDTAVVNYWCAVPASWPVAQKVYVIVTIENAGGTVLTSWVQQTGLDDCIYDVNGDGFVNITDIQMVNIAFQNGNATPAALQWNSSLDVDNNNIVNVLDVQPVAKSFQGIAGYVCPASGGFVFLPQERQANTETQVLIYPNPSSGKFNINHYGLLGEKYEVEIYNVFGEKVFSERIPSKQPAIQQLGNSKVDLSNQPNGIYFLHVQYENVSDQKESIRTVEKIIIQK